MKSLREIQVEAAQLVQKGSELRLNSPGGLPTGIGESATGPLLRLPDFVPAHGGSRYERFIDAVLTKNEFTYRLMEHRVSLSDRTHGRDEMPYMLNFGSAEDVLRAGYEMTEQENLTSQLEDFSYRRRATEQEDEESRSELEQLLEVRQLPPAECLRMKAEIGAFIEGRVRPHELVLHSITRQLGRESLAETQTQANALRLTIEEP